jgi:hypothetical protein
MAYPVDITVQPLLKHRDRVTTFFRFFLAIPHLILVGGAAFGFGSGMSGRGGWSLGSGEGLLGAVAFFLAVISWFTIVIAGTHIIGIRQFTQFFLRWRTRVIAYLMLFEDAYPPFGDDAYPASIAIVDPAGARDRVTVAFRIILAIPHFIVLAFVMLGWCITTIIAWFAILFTGEYPAGLWDFGVGTMRWMLRVEAYMLLLVDEYPPFSLSE